MKRILIVANRTLCEQHLFDEVHRRREESAVTFHLLVPASHPSGGWTDAQATSLSETAPPKSSDCTPMRRSFIQNTPSRVAGT